MSCLLLSVLFRLARTEQEDGLKELRFLLSFIILIICFFQFQKFQDLGLDVTILYNQPGQWQKCILMMDRWPDQEVNSKW